MKVEYLEGQEVSDESLFEVIDRSQTRSLTRRYLFQEDEIENLEFMGTEKVR